MIDSAELDDRIAKCEKILLADESSQIFAALADAYRKKGDLQKAQDICLKGLRLHPKYSAARVVLAKIHIAKGNYDAAWEELKKAVVSSGRTRAIDILEAEILIRKGQKSMARTILERLYSADPNDETIKNLISMLGEVKAAVANPLIDVPAEIGHPAGKRPLSLSQAIGILKVMPRVMGVMAVDHNGFVLEGRFDSIFKKEELAALSKGIYDATSNGAGKVDLGLPTEVLVETATTKLWIFHKGKFLLVILARDDVNMGSLKLKIEEVLHRVEDLLNEKEEIKEPTQ